MDASTANKRTGIMDYEPSIEWCKGEYTDMYIEECLSLIYQGLYTAQHFDEVYTGIVKTYINPDCPDLVASRAGIDVMTGGAVHYLSMLQLDYTVIHKHSVVWPGFDFMPDAVMGVSIYYPNKETSSNYAPGMNISQASLAALMQFARELAIVEHNQPSLHMNPHHA